MNVYTYRETKLIQPLFEAFTKDTGIKVNVISASSGLEQRIKTEGANSPADVLLNRPPQERGSYAATECREPAGCLDGVRRVWLVTTRGGTDPLRRVDGARGEALRDRFVVARVAQFHRIRVVELVAEG